MPSTVRAENTDPCAGRDRCSVVQEHDAGTDTAGNRLTVVETLITNPPEADKDEQCYVTNEPVGGQEYWLKTTAPDGSVTLTGQPLRTVCEEYRGSGIDHREVQIHPNRLDYTEQAGTRYRWEYTRSYRLAPLQILTFGDCYFITMQYDATSLQATVEPLEIRVWKQSDDESESDESESEDKFVGCPNWHDKPHTHLGLPMVSLRTKVPAGTVIGTCGTDVTADKGFVTLGTSGGSSFRAVLFQDGGLLVQVHDPDPMVENAQSRVAEDHLEVWTHIGKTTRIGVSLRDGAVHTSYGNPIPPRASRRDAHDEQGRPVTLLHLRWPSAEALFGSRRWDPAMSLVYAEGRNGQAPHRMLATSPVDAESAEAGERSTLGPMQAMPVACAVENGVLTITEILPFESPTEPLP